MAALLCILAVCSCNTAPLSGTDTSTPVSTEAMVQLASTQISSPTSLISTKVAASSTREITPLSITPGSPHTTTNLQCATYVETRWGTEPGEFGLCPASSPAWARGPYPPRLDGQGGLFIVDKVNKRILRYVRNKAPQVIPIPSSYVLSDVCSYSNIEWPNVSVSKDRLFFLFSAWQGGRIVDQLAVLSLEGREQKVIDLELYYPLHSPYMNSLIADRNGGVYLLLPPAGVVHFDTNLQPEFKYLGSSDLSIYENLVVGWDHNLYTYRIEPDLLNNWGRDNRYFKQDSLSWTENIISGTQIVSPTFTSLIGADTQGLLYFRTKEQDIGWLFVRVSASGDQRTVATAPKELSSSFYGSDLAPDGSLYDVIYDSKDSSVKPKIVKCEFPPN
jgi:hypothetical protein